MKLLAILFTLFNLFLVPLRTWADAPTFPRALPEGYVSGILQLFPEGKEIDASLTSYNVDPNIHLFREAELFITFLHEGAGLNNRFGYFLYEDTDDDGSIALDEIQRSETIFSQVVAKTEGGTLSSGDTVSLGKFPAGTNLGFFLHAHSYDQSEWTFYTIDPLNFDGHRHLAMMVTPDGENIALGIEDLPWNRSDRDFNDIMFSITTEPKSALQEIIDEGNIPGAPAPSPTPQPLPSPSPPPVAAPAIEMTAPKVFELPEPEPQTTAPGVMLHGGGLMMCGLSKSADENSARATLWFGSALLVSYLAIRLMRI